MTSGWDSLCVGSDRQGGVSLCCLDSSLTRWSKAALSLIVFFFFFSCLLLICEQYLGHRFNCCQQLWKMWNNHDTCHKLLTSFLLQFHLFLLDSGFLLCHCRTAHLKQVYRFYSILMWTVHCWASWDCDVQAASKLPPPLQAVHQFDPATPRGPQEVSQSQPTERKSAPGAFLSMWQVYGCVESWGPYRET